MMQNKIIISLTHYIFFYINFTLVNALVGRSVRDAVEGEYTNVVAIIRQGNVPHNFQQDFRCTGTLISYYHVLSSEHCFGSVGTQSMYVFVGSVDLRQATPYYIAWWVTYNQWAQVENRTLISNFHDVLIMKLILKVPETIHPAVILPDENTNLYGLDVVLAGWGQDGGWIPNILRIGHTRIISNEDCESIVYRILGHILVVDERYMCSIAQPSVLTSNGDSGGPVLHGCFILGVNYGTCPKTENIEDSRKANLHCSIYYYREFTSSVMQT